MKPTLNNWALIKRASEVLPAPEEPGCRVMTDELMTSIIVGKRGESVITKSGSEYPLGTVDPEYESMHPNAKARLIAALPEV